MQEINLLQSKIKDREEQWQKNNRSANIVLFLILAAVLGVGGLFWWLDSGSADKIQEVAAETVRIQSEIDSQQETLDTATAYQAQLKNLERVLGNHVAWSNVFNELAEYTLTGIAYGSLQGDLDSAIHLEGEAATYNQLAKLLMGLSTSENFEKAQLLSTAKSSGESLTVAFSIDLTVASNLYKPR